MNEKPNYFALIPANVRYANIKPNAKLMYGEITALANVKGYCYANNNYFAKLYNLKRKQTVSDWLNQLKALGAIKVVHVKDGNRILERRIYIQPDVTLQRKNVAPPNEKTLHPTTKKRKENSTSNNNTSVNNLSQRSADSSKQRERKKKNKLDQAYQKWCDRVGAKVANFGMQYTEEHVTDSNRYLSYFLKLMEDWQSHHLTSIRMIQNHIKGGQKLPEPQAIIPEWMQEDAGELEELEEPKVTPEERAKVAEMLKKFNHDNEYFEGEEAESNERTD